MWLRNRRRIPWILGTYNESSASVRAGLDMEQLLTQPQRED